MCTFQEGALEYELLGAVRAQSGLPALTAFDLLKQKGACLAHFCAAVQTLAREGTLRSSDSAQPLDDDVTPAKLMNLALEADLEPPGERKTRTLGAGFKIFLDQPLGRGSFGMVYYGEQLRLKRPVAVKLLRLSLLSGDIPRDWFIDRFRREPRIIAGLNHPHIVQVIDCGEEPDCLWYAMEFLAGGTLSDRIRREGKLPPAEVRVYFRAVTEALLEAARHGIQHRDVKPANVFNTGPKLADFGLAKLPTRAESGPPGATTPKAAMIGTPPYVAPERANFQAGDLRSDIYSLGATMYHAATGRYLFDVDPGDRSRWYHAHLHTEPRAVRELLPDFPKDLAAVIHRCLVKDPNDRFQMFESLLERLGK